MGVEECTSHEAWYATILATPKLPRTVALSKRQTFWFKCESCPDFKRKVRFSHNEARKDWNEHNILVHEGRKSSMTKDEAIALLLTQSVVS